MAAGKNHFLFFVKKMRLGPLRAGIQMQFLAVGNFGQVDQPVKKFFAVAFPSGSGKRHQIVNVKKFSARQMFTKPITGDGGDFAIGFEEDEKITPALKSHCRCGRNSRRTGKQRTMSLSVSTGRMKIDCTEKT